MITVFTNGCFDIIHPGHVDLLKRARSLGDRLVVGINSDRSVRNIKGAGRPVFKEEGRRKILLSMESVDEVVIFDDQTPEALIKKISPDILVKGGDWKPEEIIGSAFVLSRGGKVFALPFIEDYSTTGVIDSLSSQNDSTAVDTRSNIVSASLREHVDAILTLLESCEDNIRLCGELIINTFLKGNKVLVCGNGGSAADAQHIAAEFVGRYEAERRSLPAVALTTDTSALTAIGNDYGFERVFARQVESLADEGDCLIAISTSGNSPNVVAAIMEARRKGCKIIGLSGKGGKKLAALSDVSVLVPAPRTARIQEAHITIAHIWCEMVDEAFRGASK
jgi:D-sedoheptulose 7-phosphate isomerase